MAREAEIVLCSNGERRAVVFETPANSDSWPIVRVEGEPMLLEKGSVEGGLFYKKSEEINGGTTPEQEKRGELT